MNNRWISDVLKQTYGQKIYKLSLQSGCSCPNRDGTIGVGGCSFCSEGGSGDFAARVAPISEQIAEARLRVDKKMPSSLSDSDKKYIAYFQSFTNTYGDTDMLKKLFTEAINRPEIVILSIGTRPDCISDEMLDILSSLNSIKPVWIELGLQTIHEVTATRINRCYTLSCFEETYHRLKNAGLTVITHVILGLPGETHEDMYATVRYLSTLDPTLDGIKLQLLHILKNTRLYEEYIESPFHIMSLEEYTEVLINCIKLLPEETVIHRLTGDAPKALLVEPKWSANKKVVLNTIVKRLRDEL
ncbi:hypothetical protein SAMN04487934_102133 [Eubacterium ruminantium]|nr:hypothetical protein SAMN04487934_102133 [Eubacterium ruminantium]